MTENVKYMVGVGSSEREQNWGSIMISKTEEKRKIYVRYLEIGMQMTKSKK